MSDVTDDLRSYWARRFVRNQVSDLISGRVWREINRQPSNVVGPINTQVLGQIYRFMEREL